MTPLEHFGLDEAADERAVKRAYALRLKGARPDEDPVGFQKLNEAYREALAYLAWKARAAAAEENGEHVSLDVGAARTPGQPRRTDATLQYDPSVDASEAPQAPPTPFVLDLDAFFSGFREEAETSAPEALRQWLATQTRDWPIHAKSIAAQHLIEDFTADEPDISIEQFEVIANFLNLDDVLLGIDPLALDQLRQRIRDQKSGQRRQTALQRLLAPQNRRELVDYMAWTGRGSWRAMSTRFMAWVLTNSNPDSHADGWTKLLRPVPFVSRNVMAFLRSLDEGRFDALAPAIDPTTVAFWEWADVRREANKRVRYAGAFVVWLGFMGLNAAMNHHNSTLSSRNSTTTGTPTQTRSISTEAKLLEQIRSAEKQFQFAAQFSSENDKPIAVTAYAKVIADTPLDASPRLRTIVAMAMFNRANVLKQLNRLEEADAQYTTLARTFVFKYKDEVDAQIWVARGLFNQGNIWFDKKDMTRAADHYSRVLINYGDREQSDFRVQIAKSSFNLGIVHRDNRDPARARAVLQDFINRFAGAPQATGEDAATIQSLIDRAQAVLESLP